MNNGNKLENTVGEENIRGQTWRIIQKFFGGYWRKRLKAAFNLVFRVRMTVLRTVWLRSASSFFIPFKYTYFSHGFILLHHECTLFLDVEERSFKPIAYFRTGKLARRWRTKAFALSGNTHFSYVICSWYSRERKI